MAFTSGCKLTSSVAEELGELPRCRLNNLKSYVCRGNFGKCFMATTTIAAAQQLAGTSTSPPVTKYINLMKAFAVNNITLTECYRPMKYSYCLLYSGINAWLLILRQSITSTLFCMLALRCSCRERSQNNVN